MPFFRPASRALSHLLRHEPLHHCSPASILSRHSPFAPITRAFDDPFFSSPFSAPLYTVYEVRDEDNHNTNTNNKAAQSQTNKNEEMKAADSQQQQQQQQQQRSADNRVARHEDSNRQRWLDRRANRRHRHSHHHPLSLLSSPFDSLLASPFYAASSYQPLDITIDLYSTPNAYQVNAAIPGVRKEDIKLTLDDGVLTIEAERREERGRPNSSKSSATTSTPAASSNTSTATATASESSHADAKSADVDVKSDSVNSTGDSSQPDTAAQTQPQQQQQSTTAAEQHTADEDEQQVSAHHVESYYGRVSRSIALPEDVNMEGLTARYEDGVLRIELPRVEEKKQQVKQINIQ